MSLLSSNPGPNSAGSANLTATMGVSIVDSGSPSMTYAQLVANGSSTLKAGDLATTTDFGECYWTGSAWVSFTSGGAAPVFNNGITATVAASVNNYAPTGYVAGFTNLLRLTAASGGSTITGLVAPAGAWTVLIENPSSTDILSFPHLSASSLAANRFSNQNAGTWSIPALGSAYINNIPGTGWVFA